jgi:hypothetical protein
MPQLSIETEYGQVWVVWNTGVGGMAVGTAHIYPGGRKILEFHNFTDEGEIRRLVERTVEEELGDNANSSNNEG